MKFTGERYVPGAVGQEQLYIEHMSRYLFARGLARGRRVLDVGSGCGYGTYRLAEAGAESVLGVDIAPEAVAYASRNYRRPNLSFAEMDASCLELRGSFGLVTCFELIEHVEDAEGVLKGVREVLDDSGVFIVSTPNKATYAAGGADGDNPFHVREYHRGEFEDLLGSVFRSVRILGQHWVEGMVFRPHPALAGGGEAPAAGLPEDEVPAPDSACDRAAASARPAGSVVESGAGPDRAADGEPPYFVAVCAADDVLDYVIPGLTPLAVYNRAARYDMLKKAAIDLEREFDKRGEWAKGLDREVGLRDKTIDLLRRQLEELRLRFEERGRWAESLNTRLRHSGGLVERLAEENRCLRESLAERRPADWIKVTE